MEGTQGGPGIAWLIYALITVVAWGLYGILLHTGQLSMGDPVHGRYKAFLFVGIAYFLTAVLAPLAMLVLEGATWHYPAAGMFWSLIAGILGAIGAFCVLLAFGAKGSPATVMAIIFAGAPIVNALVAIAIHPPAGGFGAIRWQFVAGIALAALGGCLVTLYKPGPTAKPVPAAIHEVQAPPVGALGRRLIAETHGEFFGKIPRHNGGHGMGKTGSARIVPRLVCAGALLGVLATAALPAGAGDWPSWRGPDHDGTSDETGLVSSWSPEGENLIWKADLIGRSTPAVFDGRACFTGRVGEDNFRQEIVACFDAGSGRKLWEDRFNVYNTTVPFNRVGWASPVGDPETGYLFINGVAGQVTAYDRAGKIVWSHFVTEEFGRLSGYGGRTQTPIVDGDQLLLSSVTSSWGAHAAPRHRYFSFDKRTGAVNWIAQPGNMPYDMNTQSVPVVAEIGGRRLLISGNADGFIYALDVASGEKIWGFELGLRGINSSVIVVGDRVFASHSEENPDDALMGRVVAIDGTGRGDVTKTHEIWRINELSQGFASPTYHAGRLYVVDNAANLRAVDAATGKVVWEYSLGTVGKGSPVHADGKLYVTETNGRFHILEPGKEGARPLDVDVLKVDGGRDAEIYGSPAIAYGRIYFATEAGVYCLGDKTRPFQVAGGSQTQKPKVSQDKPVTLRVFPGEVRMRPGETVRFQARGFDALGRPTGDVPAAWTLEGLAGAVQEGAFTAEDEVQFQAGSVVARFGELEAQARVRSISDLPWFWSFDDFAEQAVPGHWIGAKGKWEVRVLDGDKVLSKIVRSAGLLRNEVFLGSSTLSNYTIEADVMGGKSANGRRLTDAGVIASGYTLDLRGNAQKLEIRSWGSEERMVVEVPFAWEMNRWYRIKFRAETGPDKAILQGKVWPKGEAEPAEWTIQVEDPLPIRAGSPGLVGYSPADLYYDNIKVTVNR